MKNKKRTIINLGNDLYWGQLGATYHKPSALKYRTRSSAKRIIHEYLKNEYPNAKVEVIENEH